MTVPSIAAPVVVIVTMASRIITTASGIVITASGIVTTAASGIFCPMTLVVTTRFLTRTSRSSSSAASGAEIIRPVTDSGLTRLQNLLHKLVDKRNSDGVVT